MHNPLCSHEIDAHARKSSERCWLQRHGEAVAGVGVRAGLDGNSVGDKNSHAAGNYGFVCIALFGQLGRSDASRLRQLLKGLDPNEDVECTSNAHVLQPSRDSIVWFLQCSPDSVSLFQQGHFLRRR